MLRVILLSLVALAWASDGYSDGKGYPPKDDGYGKGYPRIDDGYGKGYPPKDDGYGKDPYVKDPYGKDPYGKDPYGKDPYKDDGYGKNTYDGYGKGGYFNSYRYSGKRLSGYNSRYKGTDLEDVDFLIRTVEDDLHELQEGIGIATTLCGVGDDRLQKIRVKTLPTLNLADEQQNALIELFKDYIKALQHRADEAQSTVDGNKERALGTRSEIATQRYLLNQVKVGNAWEDKEIANLTKQIADHKESVIKNIGDSIEFLENDLKKVRGKVDVLHEFVDDRKCEYGFFSLDLDRDDSSRRIDFKTVFGETPEVTVTHVGFKAHLDVGYHYDGYGKGGYGKDGYGEDGYGKDGYGKDGYGKDGDGYGKDDGYGKKEYDVLGIDKFVEKVVDAKGFVARALDRSSGRVDVTTVYCVYMACQKIGGGPILPKY